MQLSDFRKEPKGPYLFEYWSSLSSLPSQIGRFNIELQMPEGSEPDSQMLSEASQLASAFQGNASGVVAKVYEHYLEMQQHTEWLQECGVPEHLSVAELQNYIRSRSLVVSRDDHNGEPVYSSGVYVSPLWDIEHGIYLCITPGGVSFEQ